MNMSMLKVMIVDDEILTRIGMRSIIPWEEYGLQVVGEAEDGEQALGLAKEIVPDIVLADIMMPKMDGLIFIRELKRIQPDCKFLILSCVDEVSYLQEAIKLGVSGYILKSAIEPQNMMEEVTRVIEEIKAERVCDDTDMEEHRYVNANAVLGEYANLVLRGFITDKQAVRERFESAFMNPCDASVFLVCIEIPKVEILSAVKGVEYSVAAICQNIIETMAGGKVFLTDSTKLWAVISYREDGVQLLKDICNRLELTMYQYLDMHLSFGIVRVVKDDFDLPKYYEQADIALSQRFYKPQCRFCFFEDLLITREIQDKIKNSMERCRFIDDMNTFGEDVRNLYMLLQDYPVIPEKELKEAMKQTIAVLTALSAPNQERQNKLKEMFCKIMECASCEELFRCMQEWIIGFDELAVCANSGDTLIGEVIRYIKNNIGEKLTLGGIAKQVYLNPDYLCKLFKKKTGENLIAYILKYKISLSKEYLKEGMRITQISECLGFSSEGHFITTFKKLCGITPGAYMKKIHK